MRATLLRPRGHEPCQLSHDAISPVQLVSHLMRRHTESKTSKAGRYRLQSTHPASPIYSPATVAG